MQNGGQVLWSEKPQSDQRECKTQYQHQKEQRAKDCRDYVEQRSAELARELANWRDWMDLVRTLQH